VPVSVTGKVVVAGVAGSSASGRPPGRWPGDRCAASPDV